MNIRKLLTATAVAAVLTGALMACGDQNQVGSNKLTDFTPAPVPSPSPSPSPVAPPPPVVVVKPPSGQPPPPPTVVQVAIITNSPYFSPADVRISHGAFVKWVNQDSQTDYIQILNSAGATLTQSPTIPPGGSWQYQFTSPGPYKYTDRRPYANGSVTAS